MHRSIFTRATGLLAAVLFASLAGCQTLQADEATRGGDDFWVNNGQLFKGDESYDITAIAVPDLAARGAELQVMVPALAKIASHGGNAVAFDLPGFSGDGGSLSPHALKMVQAYADRAKDQRMRVIVDVLGDSEDPDFRARAVRTAARLMKREPRVIYLIDGPDAGELAAKFKSAAPKLCVAAPANGDLLLVDAAPETPQPGVAYLVRSLHVPVNASMNILLAGNEDDYTALDQALMTEVEKQAYTPDQSMLSEAERAEGFVSLFNGKDFNNWWVFGDNPKGFHVNDCGAIEWVESGAAALMSQKRYSDFILRVEYKIMTEGNSGIFVRAPRAARQSKIGMEFQIHGDFGVKPSDDGTGAVYTVVAPTSNAAKPNGKWNSLEIRFEGPHLKATLNGVVVQDISFDDNEELKYRLRDGFIGLQDHDNYVAFRNIRIKEL
ncbi:MAG: DUF1080 domain-containing protein [Candidatus Hydrogenedens sp.]|nr:DUF1080 domain-containing protein [Candidatus Hydrogenedens sp.]